MIDLIVQIFLYISGIFAVIGSLGLLRFPDFYTRTHAATMISIGGVCLALLAFIISTFWTVYSVKALVIIIFTLLTNPTATHAIAKSAYDKGIKPKGLVKDELKDDMSKGGRHR